MFKKLLFIGLCIVLALSFIIGCAPQPAAPTAAPTAAVPAPVKPIKIGLATDLTGIFADFSMPARIGLEIAIEQANDKGGILGRPIELRVRDTKGQPDVGVAMAKELITGNGVDVLCGACSGAVTLAMADVALQQKVVHLAFPTGTNVVATKQNPYLFMMGQTADLQGYAVGDYLSTMPYTKYYIIGADYVYGHQLIDYSWGRLSKLNPKAVKIGESWPASGAADYTPYITAILSAKPEVVLAALPGIDDANFIKQAKGFGYFDKVTHATVMGLSPSVTVAFGKDFPQGIIGSSNYDAVYCEQKYPESVVFNKAYNAKAGNYTNVYGDAQEAYDAAKALFAAIQTAGTTSADKLIPALENIKVAGGPRGDVYMLPATHRLVQPCYVGVSTYLPDGKFAVLKNTKEYKGMDYLMSDDEIKAGWKK